MPITKEITRLEKSNVRLSMTIPHEDVLSQYNEMIKEYTKNVQLPGFRKGKVPQNVLERKFGDTLKKEAVGKTIEKTLEEIFDGTEMPEDEKPLPYSRPQMQDEAKIEFGEDLNFALVYDVMPKITVGQWKGLEVEVPQVKISDEDISAELESIRELNTVTIDRDEDAAAEEGDEVTISYFETGENGEELPNSRRDNFSFTLGSKTIPYQFDDDIIGMKKGEAKKLTRTFPKDTPPKDFTLTLEAIKEKIIPDINDELAQDVDEKFETLDDLKASIRDKLGKNIEAGIKKINVEKLMDKIIETTPVVLPESMVITEITGRIQNIASQYNVDGEKIMEMLSQNGDGKDNAQEKFRSSAEFALRSNLILDTLIKDNNIEASDEDINNEFERIALENGVAIEDVENRYKGERATAYLKDSVKERKMFDLLLSENTIKLGNEIKYVDFMGKNV